MSLQYINKTDLSIKMLPFYTEAKITKLSNAKAVKEAVPVAESIEKSNTNIAMVYDIYALNEMEHKNFDQMIEFKEQSLDLRKYNMEAYDTYVQMLYVCVDYYQGDSASQYKYVEKIREVPKTLKKLKKETDGLAFKIHDKPSFKLSKKSRKIIQYATMSN